MSKNDYSKPYSHPRWNDVGLPERISESTYEEEKLWLDKIAEWEKIDKNTDKFYNGKLAELKPMIFTPQGTRKEEQMKPKVSRRKEIAKIRMEIK